MNLLKFGNFAVDWKLVYALKNLNPPIDPMNDPDIAVFADVPTANTEGSVGTVNGEQGYDAWEVAKEDKSFTVYDERQIGLAIVLSKVAALTLSDDAKDATLTFNLGEGRTATMKLEHSRAKHLLTKIPSVQPKGTRPT